MLKSLDVETYFTAACRSVRLAALSLPSKEDTLDVNSPENPWAGGPAGKHSRFDARVSSDCNDSEFRTPGRRLTVKESISMASDKASGLLAADRDESIKSAWREWSET